MDSGVVKFAALLLILSIVVADKASAQDEKLTVGLSAKNCPQAENIVVNAVNNAVSQNPGIGAGLIRMAFHDCFVEGCDTSVVLDADPSKAAAETKIMGEVKAEIKAACP